MASQSQFRQFVFLRYLLYNIVILIIPVACVLTIGMQDLSHRKQVALTNLTASFEQSVNNIEGRFDELFKITRLLSSNELVKKTIDTQNSGYYDEYRLYHQLQDLRYANSIANNIYVIIEKNGQKRVIGSDGVITDLDFFKTIKYGIPPDPSQAEMRTDEWLGPVGIVYRELRVGSNIGNAVLYAQPFEMDSSKSVRKGQVLIDVSQDILTGLIVNQEQLDAFSFSDANGPSLIPLIQKSDAGGATGNKQIVLVNRSAHGREYTGIYNESAVLEGWHRQMLIGVLFLVAASLAGGVLCFWFARKNSTPIVNMLALLSETGNGKYSGNIGVLDYLQQSLSGFLSDKKLLDAELEKRLPLLQVSFIEHLLSGTLNDYSDVPAQLRELRIRLHGESYCVAVFRVASYGIEAQHHVRDSLGRMVIEAALRRNSGGNLYVYSVGDAYVTAIFALQTEESEQDAKEACRTIIHAIREEQQWHVQAAIGLVYANIADVSLSYSQARTALDSFAGSNEHELICYDRQTNIVSYFYFPAELELKLIRTAVNGNIEAVEKVFDELNKENLDNQRLSPAMLRYLLYELDGTYFKVLSGLRKKGIDVELPETQLYQVAGNIPGKEDLLLRRQRFLECAGLVQQNGKQAGAKTHEKLQAYIDSHFADVNLNLAMLSGVFGVTDVHMSRLFKEYMGSTFVQYLEQTRLSHGRGLLNTSDMTIRDVATACGYASAHAFRRAYKRYYGDLPSEHRGRANA